MIRKFPLLLFPLFFAGSLLAQKNFSRVKVNQHFIDNRSPKEDFSVSVHLKNETEVNSFFKTHKARLRVKGTDFKIIATKESEGGKHYLLTQAINNIPVYRSEIKVNTDKSGKVNSIFDNSFESVEIPETSHFPDSVTVENHLKTKYKSFEWRHERMYFFDGNDYIPIIKAVIMDLSKDISKEELYDERLNLVYEQVLTRFNTQTVKDTTADGYVFLPSPLTTAHVTYGGQYKDFNDSDIVELNAQRYKVTLNLRLENDTFRLVNDYVKITEFSDPIKKPVYSKTPIFDYTRNKSGFEDVNAFYHITQMHKYLETLGYGNLIKYQIQVDTHARSGEDNSSFDPYSTIPRLYFGIGGVDDAEDGHVIVHEYTHAIFNSASPNTSNGSERLTIEEATCDYFAISYARAHDSYLWNFIFPWDGHNEYWSGRMATTTKNYKQTTFFGVYTDADLWTATLMEIWEDLGKEVSDKIILQSLFGYVSNMKMPQAARLIIKADSTLYGGQHYHQIFKRFADRAILQYPLGINESTTNTDDYITIRNTAAFASQNEAIYISVLLPENFTVCIFNLNGQKVFEQTFMQRQEAQIKPDLQAGVYLLNIRTGNRNRTVKIVRY